MKMVEIFTRCFQECALLVHILKGEATFSFWLKKMIQYSSELEYCIRESIDNLKLGGVYTSFDSKCSGAFDVKYIIFMTYTIKISKKDEGNNMRTFVPFRENGSEILSDIFKFFLS